ncbi:LexA family transcriptional regulator [Zavarzinia sp.]|uniref:LexA family transcriptional regulator n=1 Tax=Zavarzinia sp. TaxID=2027920 RepID=UPI003BB63326
MSATRNAKHPPHPRLRQARRAAGYASAGSFARAAGIEEGGYRHHENGTRPLTVEAAQKYAPLLRCDWVWLFNGAAISDAAISHLDNDAEMMGDDDNGPLERMGFALINVYDATLSAGHGAVNGQRIAVNHKLAFRLDWLRSRTSASLDKIGILRVHGNSMEPDLRSGDTVLLDMSVTEIRRDGMYAISYRDGDEAMVKNIRRDPRNRRLIIRSSNSSDYPEIPDVRDDDIIVWGRVLWVGRNIE